MKKYLSTSVFLYYLLINTCTAQTLDAEQIYKKVNDAVVTIYAYDSYSKMLSQGSGVVLNDKGWIVTNYHVYDGSDKMVIKHNEKTIEYSEIIGVNADKDILILKIADKTFPSISIGNSDDLNVGQRIYAIGSPMGFENSISEGIVSGLRSFILEKQNFIQISAPISHGSSGGAVVNAKGELIGISSGGMDEGQNLNFAIPVNDVMEVYKSGGVTNITLTTEKFYSDGLKAIENKDFNTAMSYFKKAIAINDKCYQAYNKLGLLYYSYLKDASAAINNINKAISIKSDFAEAYTGLGLIYTMTDKTDLGISNLKKAISYDPNYLQTYGCIALAYCKLHNYETAIYYLNKSIEINPNSSDPYYNFGQLYMHKYKTYGNKKDAETGLYYMEKGQKYLKE